MTVARLEKELGSGELAEWASLVSSGSPWGEYREEMLWLDLVSHVVMAPRHPDPGALIKGLKLPWDRRAEEKKPATGAEWAAKLAAWGGRIVRNADVS